LTLEKEKILIAEILDGNTDAFEDLLFANQKNVYNLALKMTGNQADAEDIAQEAFIKAFRLLGGFRGESRFSVWLYRLTYNQCIDFLRKKKQVSMISLSQEYDGGDEHEFDIPDLQELPEDSVLRNELREIIDESIKELDIFHREIIIMREVTDMSYSDIATTLNISEGTVKSRLSRARKILAQILIRKGA
jgi:RNA polymerase sigma-70 factor (ECF subfamily)